MLEKIKNSYISLNMPIPQLIFPCKGPFLKLSHIVMKALKCKPSAQFAYNYTINVLSNCSNMISHRSSVFEDRHNDHRSSKVGTSIIHLRRSTHRSSIFEGRHIDHRSSKVDTSIIDLGRSTHGSSKIEGGKIAPTTQHRTDIPSPNIVHNGTP